MSNSFIFKVKTYSPLHAGAGQSMGIVDLPIQREKHTNYPCVYASGLKGSLRDYCEKNSPTIVDAVFGKEDSNSAAGGAVFTDLKLLFFPVRSSKGCFKYVTSLNIINRYNEFCDMLELPMSKIITTNTPASPVTTANFDQTQHILLEDFIFPTTAATISLNGVSVNNVYIIPEDEFKHLVTTATQVIARNQLNPNKTSNNLWYEEALPADTILYSFVKPSVANNGSLNNLKDTINEKFVQIGGGETVGYGMCKIDILGGN
jgi:CRISPR-associated protein Cmr4